MPAPHHVQSLEDYWLWLEELIYNAGGWLRRGRTLLVEPIVESAVEWLAVKFPPQYIDFADRSSLHWSTTVDHDFTISKFSFHYQDAGGSLIWRKDNVHAAPHLTHPEHIHRPPMGSNAAAFDAVDLEEALREVADFIETGKRP